MVTEERSEQNEEETRDIRPVEVEEPAAPKSMPRDEVDRVRRQADELLARLAETTGSEELEALDSVTSVGRQAQRNSAGEFDLLKARMGTFLNEGGASKDIADGLRDLRTTLNEINPAEVTNPGIRGRIVGALPIVGGRFNPLVRGLNKIALRYEPVSQQVAVIETKLSDGRALLVRDNIELRRLYEDVEAQQGPIKSNAYLGELLAQRLARMLEQTDDPMKHDRLQGALADVLERVQDLRTMEEVHLQYFVSIEMSRQNNNRLVQSVDRTLTLATNVVTVGLAIQSALIRQKKVTQATRRTREFLGDLVTANAMAIKQHTQEIGDLYNDPVISMEKISQAHNDLVEAMETASRLRQAGIESARENIAQISEMTAELERKAGGMIQERAPELGVART
ncbi:MAG: toxic anion resistance protein [Chloroflexi bacterium]|nr:toxic anion resistance protein [Chloroflexota bacterium]